MSNLNRRGIAGWDLLLILSLIGVLVAAWFAFVQPKPPPVARAQPGSSLAEIEVSTRNLESSAVAGEKAIAARTWNLSVDTLGSEILSNLTRLAETRHLEVKGFRSGRVIPAASLQEASFVVVFEGAFMDVMAAVKELERPESKLALSQLKIASKSDPDQVTATLALTGFLLREVK